MAGLAEAETFTFSEYEREQFPKALRKVYDPIDEAARPVDESGGNPAPDNTPAAAAPVSPDVVTPQGEPVEEIAPQAPLQSDGAPSLDDRLRRFESALAGLTEKHSATERALADEQAENARLRSELEQKATAAPVTLPADIPTESQVYKDVYGATDDELDVGMDIPSLMLKITRKEVGEAVRRMESTIDGKLAGFHTVVSEAAESKRLKYVEQRNGLVPDFVQMNDDAGFLAWLKGKDTKTDMVREGLLDGAHKRMDPKAVAGFFDEYRASVGKAKPSGTPSTAPYVMPEQGAAASRATTATAKKTYSRADYLRLTNQANQLRNTNPKRAADLDAELDAAYQDGRVTQ